MLVQLGFAIPGGYRAASLLNCPLEKVGFVRACEELLKIFFIMGRLKSGKWIRKVIEE